MLQSENSASVFFTSHRLECLNFGERLFLAKKNATSELRLPVVKSETLFVPIKNGPSPDGPQHRLGVEWQAQEPHQRHKKTKERREKRKNEESPNKRECFLSHTTLHCLSPIFLFVVFSDLCIFCCSSLAFVFRNREWNISHHIHVQG